ncbi:hypothetical protein ACWGKQ_27000 [Streptomyces sp. NPDC054770]
MCTLRFELLDHPAWAGEETARRSADLGVDRAARHEADLVAVEGESAVVRCGEVGGKEERVLAERPSRTATPSVS